MPRTQEAVLATIASLNFLLRSSSTAPDFFSRQDGPFSPCPFFSIAAILEEEQAKFAAVPPCAATAVGYDFYGACTLSNQMSTPDSSGSGSGSRSSGD